MSEKDESSLSKNYIAQSTQVEMAAKAPSRTILKPYSTDIVLVQLQ
jgi:hypothetical protein